MKRRDVPVVLPVNLTMASNDSDLVPETTNLLKNRNISTGDMEDFCKFVNGMNNSSTDLGAFCIKYVSSDTTDDSMEAYCGENVLQFSLKYRSIHGYLSLVVCIFGTIANILNIIVLTRKDMATPINSILTALAVADMLVMVEYVPFACQRYIFTLDDQFSYEWAVFVFFHAYFTQVFHTISIWLTVTLAVWRYLAISYPQKSQTLCTMPRCRMALTSAYLFPVILCTPTFLIYTINQRQGGDVQYVVELSEAAKADDQLWHRIYVWIYSVVIKLLPCLLLTVLSYWLIRALYRANKHKHKLNQQAIATADGEKRASKYDKRTDRTTKMLVAVLLLFLVTEFPQGILSLLSGFYGEDFFRSCYKPFGDVMDILALLNSAINFILYCSMSRQFRRTFGELFNPRVLSKWAPVTQTDVQSTYV